MEKPNIAVVIGTTRATRFGEKPVKWIFDIAVARGDMSIELIDLRDYPQNATEMLDELHWWASALSTARTAVSMDNSDA
jgi:NAD(P)H-dependent FMN reductase